MGAGLSNTIKLMPVAEPACTARSAIGWLSLKKPRICALDKLGQRETVVCHQNKLGPRKYGG